MTRDTHKICYFGQVYFHKDGEMMEEYKHLDNTKECEGLIEESDQEVFGKFCGRSNVAIISPMEVYLRYYLIMYKYK